MVRFLSPGWIAALDKAAQEATVETRLVFQQVVTGCPNGDGEVRYHLRFEEGSLTVHGGTAPEPDLTVTASYPVAAALARGELNAQQALAAGQLRLSGNIDVLVSQARPLAQLADIFAAVREDTTY